MRIILFSPENLVLPPGPRPYGPEAGPGQNSMALPVNMLSGIGVLEY